MIDPSGPGSDSPSLTRSTAEAREAAREALALVERGERNSLDRLRDAVCSYVAALHAEGLGKEEALEKVRLLIASPTSSEDTWLLPVAREALTDLAMHWCTQQYQ